MDASGHPGQAAGNGIAIKTDRAGLLRWTPLYAADAPIRGRMKRWTWPEFSRAEVRRDGSVVLYLLPHWSRRRQSFTVGPYARPGGRAALAAAIGVRLPIGSSEPTVTDSRRRRNAFAATVLLVAIPLYG